MQARLGIAFLIAAGGLLHSTAYASGSGPGPGDLYELRIESLPLDQSLQELARQSGMQVVFFSRVVEGLHAPPLSGEYTLSKALDTLLDGSDLRFRIINRRTVEVEALKHVGPRERDPFSTTAVAGEPRNTNQNTRAAADDSNLAEVTIGASATGLTATRIETPLRDIPQTFTILPREQLRQQNASSIDDALAMAPGLTAVRDSSLEQHFLSRGFGMSALHIDGSSALNPANIATSPFSANLDLSEFDRIEVLRGADALFGADSEPGGTINLIRKRPQQNLAVDLTTWAGSWGNYRLEGDITGPLVSSGRVRGRLIGVYSDREYFFNIASLQRKKIFGALEADLTPDTLLTVGGGYQWDKAVPFFTGWPTYVDGSDAHLPRSFAMVMDWTRYDTGTREIYFQLTQTLGSAWKLRASGVSLDSIVRYADARIRSSLEPGTRALYGRAGSLYSAVPGQQRQLAFDVTLTGEFEMFGRRSEIAVGGDLGRFHIRGAELLGDGFGPVLGDVLDFDPADFPEPPPPQDPKWVITERALVHLSGVFASLKAYATDDLSFIGGLRVSNARHAGYAEYFLNDRLLLRSGSGSRDKNKVTPYAGVVYELSPTYSLYASYADIFKSVAVKRDLDKNESLRPADGVVIEGGIKSAWRGGDVNGAFALYRIKQSGLPEPDPRQPATGSSSRCCFLPSGAKRSEGVDLELAGTLAPNWLIGMGYSYNTNRDVDRGPLSDQTPRHLLKAWTSLTLPGTLSQWTIGGSLHAQSKVSTAGDSCPVSCEEPQIPYNIRQASYMTLTLRAGYDIDAHWRAAFTVGNVLDKRYYEAIYYPEWNNWYGEPRSVLFRLDGRY